MSLIDYLTLGAPGSGLNRAVGIRGIDYYAIDLTNFDSGKIGVDIQPLILGGGIEFQFPMGFGVVPEVSAARAHFSFFSKDVYSAEGGFYWPGNPASFNLGVAFGGAIGMTFDVNSAQQRFFGDLLNEIDFVLDN